MDLGIIVVWLSLIVYTVIVMETKIVNKKERKLVFILVTVTVACSFLVLLHISLHGVVTFLNDTFGRLSRMVVKI
jgi:hypothetical protein